MRVTFPDKDTPTIEGEVCRIHQYQRRKRVIMDTSGYNKHGAQAKRKKADAGACAGRG